MKVADVMSHKVVSVLPDLPVQSLASLLVERRISAVPVKDATGRIIGIVSEGDLMRRPETGTERHSSWWLRAFASSESLAERYIKAHGLTAKDVMTKNVVTIDPDASVHEAAEIMEKHGIKRLPVLRNGMLVGIVGRADLVRVLAAAPPLQAGAHDDAVIRERIEEALEKEDWARQSDLYITVLNHTAHLWGSVGSVAQHDAMEILARGTPGVSSVKNHLTIRPKAIAMPPMV